MIVSIAGSFNAVLRSSSVSTLTVVVVPSTGSIAAETGNDAILMTDNVRALKKPAKPLRVNAFVLKQDFLMTAPS
jgi:hypothetical protein